MKTLTVRLKEYELVKIKQEADDKNMSLNEYVRDVVFNKTSAEEALTKIEKTRNEITDALFSFRQDLGRVQHDLMKVIRDANEVLAEDMEKKLAAELDDQRAELVELITRFAKAQPARPGTAGPLKTPTSSLY